ncbi:MAG: hypothetical protein ACI9FJ_000535 [Alteromonadaceae bacterium]|jgi:hypothetical protein
MTLNENELIHLNRTGEQLKSALRNLISEMPSTAQSITGMAKWLQANKSTCQRLLNVMNKSHDGLEVIQLVPGIEGINQFIECAEAKGIDALLIQEAVKASETFKYDIQQYGRSHSQLKRQLTELDNKPHGQYSMNEAQTNRKMLYEASQQLLGESCGLCFASFIVRPNPTDDSTYQELALVAKQQIDIKAQARPFMQYFSKDNLPFAKDPKTFDELSRVVEKFDLGIVERFSSPDLKQAYSGYSRTSSSLVFNNLSNIQIPFDATFLFNNPDGAANPLTTNATTSNHSIAVKMPTERLALLVFLDKRFDRRSTVSVGCYPNSMKIEREQHTLDEVWNDRFPEFPDLKIVNSLTSVTELSGIESADAMVDYLFDYAQLSRDDFVCYMIDVQYPIWSSSYKIYFEFE